MEISDIVRIMNTIEYGFKDDDGNNMLITDPKKYEEEFPNFYYLLSPDELLDKKCGVCWDQVELERKLFSDIGLDVKTYFIYIAKEDKTPSHTFLVYQADGKFWWFENSWGKFKGVHEYKSLECLLLDVKDKFIKTYSDNEDEYTFMFEFERPEYHISCDEYYRYVQGQKLLKLNEPLYFYHVVDKNADMSKGLLSLEYMYKHKMFDLFDKYTAKYIERITGCWDIPKYKNRKSLTREEIIDALKIVRGEHGPSHICFFRYPLHKGLGKRIEELLKVKDIYRININDEDVIRNIKDIFYGYENSHGDNKVLDKAYYENISREEYFKDYDDSLEFNFATLNHISIAFIDDYCRIEFLERVDD